MSNIINISANNIRSTLLTTGSYLLLALLSIFFNFIFNFSLGLVLTGNYVSLAKFVGHTNSLNDVTYLFFIITGSLITLGLVIYVMNAIFKESTSFMQFFWGCIGLLIAYLIVDLLFLVEIKHFVDWVITALVLINRYTIFFIIGFWYVLQIYKFKPEVRNYLFSNYESVKYKKVIRKSLFAKASSLLVNQATGLIIVVILIIGGTVITEIKSTTTAIVFSILYLPMDLIIALLLMHQVNILFRGYKQKNNSNIFNDNTL